MNITSKINSGFKSLCVGVLMVAVISNGFQFVVAETLSSPNFTIQDATLNSGGQALTSSSFSMLSAIGDYTADSRLISGSYELKSGFPNGILANVPKIKCFETTTTSSDTSCLTFPTNNGAVGECGYSGCFNRAKIEIDNQDNPSDTLYLVRIVSDNTYYLKSDHTLSKTYDSSNFLTKCQIEGKDINNPNCDAIGDSGWNATLQSFNVLGLSNSTTYTASALALSGDFTGTRYCDPLSATTAAPQLFFDLDTAGESNPTAETTAPYVISLGAIQYAFSTTATNLLWFNMASNLPEGFNVYIKSQHSGLYSASKNVTIPSESEDLATDSNNNGGFGIKTFNFSPSQSGLGPLLRSATYDTGSVNAVGALSSTNTQLFYTNNSSGNRGELLDGRGAVYFKGRASVSAPPSGDYSDTLTTIIVGNF